MHTHTPRKNFFPILSLNLSTPRFPLWRSFSKPNRQQVGSLRATRRYPGRGTPAPRRARGSRCALHFLLAFSSLDPVAGRNQDGTPVAQGTCGHPCLVCPGQGSGCCSSQVAHSGALPGAGRGRQAEHRGWSLGSSWAFVAPPFGFRGGVYFAPPPPVSWVGLLLACGGL